MFSKDVFNLRKLSEMPYHLIYSGRASALDDEVLFNFEWINDKLKGQSLNDVLEDYVLALEVRPELDIRWELVIIKLNEVSYHTSVPLGLLFKIKSNLFLTEKWLNTVVVCFVVKL